MFKRYGEGWTDPTVLMGAGILEVIVGVIILIYVHAVWVFDESDTKFVGTGLALIGVARLVACAVFVYAHVATTGKRE